MAQIHWAKSVSGDFATAPDWSGGIAPGASDDAIIDPAGTYTVTLDKAESVNSLAVDAVGATVVDTAALKLGSSLTLTAGKFELDTGGEVVGGVLSASKGAFVWRGGMLTKVTYEGPLDLSAANAAVTINQSFKATGAGGTGAGTINLTGARSMLTATNNQMGIPPSIVLDKATLNVGNDSVAADLTVIGALTTGTQFNILQVGKFANVVSNGSYVWSMQGKIDAEFSGGLFEVSTINTFNDGSIIVGNGDTLDFYGDDFTNRGTISITSGGNFDTRNYNSFTFDNAAGGTISATGVGSFADLGNDAGGWSNSGTINVGAGATVRIDYVGGATLNDTGTITVGAGATLDVGGIITTSQLAAIKNNGGTISVDYRLNNTGATITVGPTGTQPGFDLHGLVIGGTVIAEGSAGFDRGGFSGVKYEGVLNLSAANTVLGVQDGFVLTGANGTGPGVANLTGEGSILGAEGILDNFTLNIGSDSGSAYALLQSYYDPTNGPVLTLGANFHIIQVGRFAQFQDFNSETFNDVLNNGSIAVGLSGGSFIVDIVNFTNDGTISVTNGDTLVFQATAIDQSGGGQLSVGGGSRVTLEGTELSGGLVTIASSGIVSAAVGGASTLDFTTGTFVNSGSLDIEAAATLILDGAFTNSSKLTLSGGGVGKIANLLMGASNATLTGGGTVSLNTSGANIIKGATATATLTNVDNTITGVGLLGDKSLTLVNQAKGVVDANAKGKVLVLDTAGQTAVNAGLMEATGGGILAIVGTTIDQTGGGSITGTGAHVELEGVDVLGGTLTNVAVTNVGMSTLDGTVSAVTLAGSPGVLTGATLTLAGTINDTGIVVMSAGAGATTLLVAAAGATLTGGGIVYLRSTGNDIAGASSGATLTNLDRIRGGGLIGGGGMSLDNSAAGLVLADLPVALTIDTGAATIVNAGAIGADAGGSLVIDSPLANTGRLSAAHGTLTVLGDVTGAGVAAVNAGVLDFEGAFAQDVAFEPTGELMLAHSQAYSGTIAGFSTTGKTSLDLKDIAFATVQTPTFSAGVLTVTDGSHTAEIHLSGNFSGSEFKASSDSHGGTIIVDPRTVAKSVPSAPLHRFIAATAALGASTVGEVSVNHEVWRETRAVIATREA